MPVFHKKDDAREYVQKKMEKNMMKLSHGQIPRFDCRLMTAELVSEIDINNVCHNPESIAWRAELLVLQFYEENNIHPVHKITLKTRIKRLRSKNVSEKKDCPYDMKTVHDYAHESGRNITDLSDYELSMFPSKTENTKQNKVCNALEYIKNEAFEEAFEAGRKKGVMHELIDLVCDHKIKVSVAAKKAEELIGIAKDDFIEEFMKAIKEETRQEGALDALSDLVEQGFVDIQLAAEQAGMSADDFQKIVRKKKGK